MGNAKERGDGMGRVRILTIRLRTLLAVCGLVAVVLLMFSNSFWRQIYPIYYYPIIQSEAKQMKVSPLLIASLVRVESHFREDDVSHAGAIGLMQLMPDTAIWIARKIGQPLPGVLGTGAGVATGAATVAGTLDPAQTKAIAEALSDPRINIRLGSWYMAYLLRLFHGDLPEAVAAYNAGPNRVQGWLRQGVWSGDQVTGDDIPVRETRHFLARVMYTYGMFVRHY